MNSIDEDENMSFVGNIIWIICGGLISFLMYFLGGIILCLTIIGIPFGVQSIKIGFATLAPFGGTTIEKSDANSPIRLIFNAIWVVTFGFGIALNHLFWAAFLGLTVIGIPFSYQHLKLIPISLFPFGREFMQ